MPGHTRPAGSRLHLLLVASAVILCISALSPAIAGAWTSVGPATWSKLTPGDDSGVVQARPKLSVEAFDPAGIKQTGYTVLLDGVAVKPSFSYKILGWNGSTPILDKRYATLNATARSDIAYGWHAVQARVTNNSNIVSEVAWSFWRTGAPALDEPQPAPGSVTDQRQPVLSVHVISNGNGLVGSFTVDGFAVPGLYNPATRIFSGVPASNLALGTHSVSVTVRNAFGYVSTLSWQFDVDVRLPMLTSGGCIDCHPGRPVGHDMNTCSNCHGLDAPLLEMEPGGLPHSPYYIYSLEYDCLFCHGRDWPTVPKVHVSSPDPWHLSDSASCLGECHASQLDSEHNQKGMTCLTCHASTDPLVKAAIAAGDTACSACHGTINPNHAFDPVKHTAAPTSPESGTWPYVETAPNLDEVYFNAPYAYSFACAECHDLQLDIEHAKATASSSTNVPVCTTCHPSPRDSFATWGKSCTQGGCHSVAGEIKHESLTAKHAMAQSEIDAGCGFVNPVNGRAPCHYRDIVQEHNRKISRRINPATHEQELVSISVTCAQCHASAAFAALGGSWDGTCDECHDGTLLPNHNVVGSARYYEVYALHNNPSGYYDNGVGNSGYNAMDAHGWIRPNPDQNSANKTIGCGVPTCHTQAYLGGGWPWYKTACSECHGANIAVPDPYQGSYAWYSEDWVDDEAMDTRLTMTLDPITLPAGSALEFKTWYDIEKDWDYGYVQISTDGGSTWVNLPGSITTNTNPYGVNLGNGITGSSSGGWVDGFFDLSAYAGQTVELRFAYIADFYTYGLGWMIDTISVGPPGAPVFYDDVETLKPEWGVATELTYYDYDLEDYVTVPSSITGWERFTR